MPCGDSSDAAYYSGKAWREAERAACDMLHALRSVSYDISLLSSETQIWVSQHDAEDRKRDQLEQEVKRRADARREALRKLSQDERRALGL